MTHTKFFEFEIKRKYLQTDKFTSICNIEVAITLKHRQLPVETLSGPDELAVWLKM